MANPLNVTAFCSGDTEGYFIANESEPDETGIITTTGKLVLDVAPGYNDNSGWNTLSDNGYSGYDVWQPDLNVERWAVGSFVMVYVAKNSEISNSGNRLGNTPLYSLHPKGRMRILEKPSPPTRSNLQLEISLGDDLTLLNWRTPDDDASGASLGSSNGRGFIIGNLLSAAGIDSWAGTVDAYPLKYPLPKQGGSYIEQAGKVAIGGAKWIWQNNQGDVLDAEFNPQPTTVFKLITLGENEVDFEPLRGEKPCSEVIVAGTGYDLENQPSDEGTSYSEEFLPKAAFGALDGDGEPQYPNDATSTLSSQTYENWYWTSNQFVRQITTYEARGLVIPDQFFLDLSASLGLDVSEPTSAFTLIVSEVSTETETYDAITGFLTRKDKITNRPIGAVFQDYYQQIALNDLFTPSGIANTNFLEVVTTEIEETVYTYKGTQTRRVEYQKQELLGAVTGSSDDWANSEIVPQDPNSLIISETTLEQWEPARNITVIGGGQDNPVDDWKKTERTRQAGQSSGSIQVMAALTTTNNTIRRTNNGQDQPPAANTKKPDFVSAEKEYKGVANLEPVNEFDSAPRSRTYRIDYATSNAQCDELSEIFSAILFGRNQGFSVTCAFDDDWFDYEPMSRIDVINRLDITAQPIRLAGLSSGVTFACAAEKSIVSVNCLKLGLEK